MNLKTTITFMAALLLVGCSPDSELPSSAGRSIEPSLAPEARFVPFPGVQWYGPEGDEISFETNIINAITGPDHCEWETGVMMHVGWPLGRDAKDASESHQYFRDPEGVFRQDDFMTSYSEDVQLPDKAKNTGYRTDFMQLWLVPGETKAAYLVFSDHVERWPRSREIIACG
jgi:hypothetical protein